MKGYLEINGVTYYENYLLTCGGFTSLVFGGVRANDWGLEAIKSLEVSSFISLLIVFHQLAELHGKIQACLSLTCYRNISGISYVNRIKMTAV